eukprot:s690_g19.t1
MALNSAVLEDPQYQKILAMKEGVKVAMVRLHYSQALRRAAVARPRVLPDYKTYAVGDVVYFYREQDLVSRKKQHVRKKRLALQRWHEPAMVLAMEGSPDTIALWPDGGDGRPEQDQAAIENGDEVAGDRDDEGAPTSGGAAGLRKDKDIKRSSAEPCVVPGETSSVGGETFLTETSFEVLDDVMSVEHFDAQDLEMAQEVAAKHTAEEEEAILGLTAASTTSLH